MSVAIARKSGCLEILAQHRYGEIENSNEVADFKAISARNRKSIAYFGFTAQKAPKVDNYFWEKPASLLRIVPIAKPENCLQWPISTKRGHQATG